MPREPKIKIGGSEIDRILTVDYTITNGADADGRPTKNRRNLGIHITRVANSNKEVANWAKSAAKSDRRKGEIELQHPDGKKMKTIKWEEGYVSQYSIHYDEALEQVVESFVVMPRVLDVEGKKLDMQWEEGH